MVNGCEQDVFLSGFCAIHLWQKTAVTVACWLQSVLHLIESVTVSSACQVVIKLSISSISSASSRSRHIIWNDFCCLMGGGIGNHHLPTLLQALTQLDVFWCLPLISLPVLLVKLWDVSVFNTAGIRTDWSRFCGRVVAIEICTVGWQHSIKRVQL